MRFSWIDLVFPIGTAVLCAVLAVFTWFVPNPWQARMIATMVAVTAVAAVPVYYALFRLPALTPDFTVHGLKVKLGKVNRPTQNEVDAWVKSVIDFWRVCAICSATVPLHLHHSSKTLTFVFVAKRSSLHNKLLVFHDKDHMTVFGRLVRGYAYEDVAVVGNYHVPNLTRHEVSHLILFAYGVPQEKHHELFASTKLGA